MDNRGCFPGVKAAEARS